MAKIIHRTGLYLSEGAFSAVRLNLQSGSVDYAAVKNAGESGILSKGVISETIKELLSGAGKKKASSYFISIPSDMAVISSVDLAKGETMTEEMVKWEMEQQIMGTISDYYMDFQKMQDDTSGRMSKYIAAAVRKTVAETIIHEASSAGIEISLLDIDLFSVQRIAENLKGSPAEFAVALSGLKKTGVAVFKNGSFAGYDIITHPEGILEEGLTGEDALNYFGGLGKRIEKSVFSLSSDTKPGKIFLAGPVYMEPSVADNIIAGLTTEAAVTDPFDNLVPETGNDDEVRSLKGMLAPAAGLLLREGEK
ncbi:MAG: type IV pilus biogenesis protein PilM [Fibrobacterota bacterium]